MEKIDHKTFLQQNWRDRKAIVEKIFGKELLDTLKWIQWKTQDEERRKILQMLLSNYKWWLMHFRKWRKDEFEDDAWNDIEYQEFQESLSDEQKILLTKINSVALCIKELRSLCFQYPELTQWEVINPGLWDVIEYHRTPEYLFTYWEIQEIGLSRDMYRKIDYIITVWKFQHTIQYMYYCMNQGYQIPYDKLIDRLYPYLMLKWEYRGLWWIDEYDTVMTWLALGERYAFPKLNQYDRSNPPEVWEKPDLEAFVQEKWTLKNSNKDLKEIQDWIAVFETEVKEDLNYFASNYEWERTDDYWYLGSSIRLIVAQAKYLPTKTINPETINPLVKKCYLYRALCGMTRCKKIAQETWYGPDYFMDDWNLLFVMEYLHRYGEAPEHWITKERVEDYLNTCVYVARGEKE
jgi:hypothetical protein